MNSDSTVEPGIEDVENKSDVKFLPILQSQAIHAFPLLLPIRLEKVKQDGKGNETVSIEVAKGSKKSIYHFLLKANEVNLDGRAVQLLWYLIMDFTRRVKRFSSVEVIEKEREVVLDIKLLASAELFDVTIQKMRTILVRAILTLKEVGWHFHEALPGQKEDDPTDWVFSVLDGVGVTHKGKVKVKLNFDFAKYLSTKYIMYLPMSVFTIKPRLNPYSIRFLDKLLDNYNLNLDDESRRGRMKLKDLIDTMYEIPKYKDIAKKGQVYQRIIFPCIRDLNQLCVLKIITRLNYEDNGVSVPSTIGFKRLSYERFEALIIHYEIDWYPVRDIPKKGKRTLV